MYREFADDNGSFVCHIKLPNETEFKGTGKSKRLAQMSACEKIRR